MKKNLLLISLLSLTLLFTGCTRDGGGNTGSNSGNNTGASNPTSTSQDTTVDISVTFYVDYNDVTATGVFATQVVKNGDKITNPGTPSEAPFEEFPNFLGWSAKEIIDDDADLWDFANDIVSVSIGNKLSIYGIWTE